MFDPLAEMPYLERYDVENYHSPPGVKLRFTFQIPGLGSPHTMTRFISADELLRTSRNPESVFEFYLEEMGRCWDDELLRVLKTLQQQRRRAVLELEGLAVASVFGYGSVPPLSFTREETYSNDMPGTTIESMAGNIASMAKLKILLNQNDPDTITD